MAIEIRRAGGLSGYGSNGTGASKICVTLVCSTLRLHSKRPFTFVSRRYDCEEGVMLVCKRNCIFQKVERPFFIC